MDSLIYSVFHDAALDRLIDNVCHLISRERDAIPRARDAGISVQTRVEQQSGESVVNNKTV